MIGAILYLEAICDSHKEKEKWRNRETKRGNSLLFTYLSQCLALSKLVLSDLYLKADGEIPDC